MVYRPIADWPSNTLLLLTSRLAYTLWILGAFLGLVTVMPRVLELKGQPPENLTVFGITAAILLLTLGCILFLNRINKELKGRLGQ